MSSLVIPKICYHFQNTPLVILFTRQLLSVLYRQMRMYCSTKSVAVVSFNTDRHAGQHSVGHRSPTLQCHTRHLKNVATHCRSSMSYCRSDAQTLTALSQWAEGSVTFRGQLLSHLQLYSETCTLGVTEPCSGDNCRDIPMGTQNSGNCRIDSKFFPCRLPQRQAK